MTIGGSSLPCQALRLGSFVNRWRAIRMGHPPAQGASDGLNGTGFLRRKKIALLLLRFGRLFSATGGVGVLLVGEIPGCICGRHPIFTDAIGGVGDSAWGLEVGVVGDGCSCCSPSP